MIRLGDSRNLTRFLVACFLVFYVDSVYSQTLNSTLRDKYDGYGIDWIFMPDGNGNPQVAVLKGFEVEGRNVLEGEISFLLFTRSGPENGTVLFTDDKAALEKSDFSPSRPTKIITHGWKSSALSPGPFNLKNAYLKYTDYNVILVDWEPLAGSTFYLGPMRNTQRVGKETGQFIDFLISEGGMDPKEIHFIGHSLGAHVAGNAGAAVTKGHLGRVTGLDPALPGIHLLSSDNLRLDKTDADFVDIIHSCGGILGYLKPLGHVDFYPNGGTAVQPGCCCIPEFVESCSHGRVYKYFTESIGTKSGFLSSRCDDWQNFVTGNCKDMDTVLMGEYVDQSATGTYFLRTNSEAPFAMIPEVVDNNL